MSAQAADLRTIDLDLALKATLIQLCRHHGILHSGLKSQLVHRLYAHRAQLPPPPAATTSATAIASSTPASSLPPTSHPLAQTATVSTAAATTSIVPTAPFVPVAQQLGLQANLSHTTTQVSPAGVTAAASTSYPRPGCRFPQCPSHSWLSPGTLWRRPSPPLSLPRPAPGTSLTSLSAGGAPPPPYVQQISMQAAQQAAQQAISQVLAQYPQAITAAGPAPPSLPGTFATLPPNLGPPPPQGPAYPPPSGDLCPNTPRPLRNSSAGCHHPLLGLPAPHCNPAAGARNAVLTGHTAAPHAPASLPPLAPFSGSIPFIPTKFATAAAAGEFIELLHALEAVSGDEPPIFMQVGEGHQLSLPSKPRRKVISAFHEWARCFCVYSHHLSAHQPLRGPDLLGTSI